MESCNKVAWRSPNPYRAHTMAYGTYQPTPGYFQGHSHEPWPWLDAGHRPACRTHSESVTVTLLTA